MAILIGVILVVSQISVLGRVNVPGIIKVGLESVYKDADSIKISSQDNLSIGYLMGETFIEEAQLQSPSITIRRTYETYYKIDDTYRTLEQAREAAIFECGVPVYIEPGVYSVYTQEGYSEAPANNKRIAIYNEQGEILFIAENDKTPIEFQGIDFEYSFPVTTVGAKKYRGSISVVNGQRKGLTAVNTVALDDEYLYGVVPGEMVPSWPMEALKAQAVAARTIAVFQYNKFETRGYNVVDTVSSQVYKGVTGEHPRTSQAVDETLGEVITYNDNIIESVYFSTSGGYTENAEDVWGSVYPYLKAVPDIYETKPEMAPWTRTITLDEIQKCVSAKGINIGQVEGLQIVSKTMAGRVKELKIIGSKDTYSLTKEEIRTFFSGTKEGSLKSRMFKFEPYDQTNNDIEQKPTQAIKEMTVMSSNNILSSKLQNAYVMSHNDIKEIEDKVGILSASDLIEVERIIESENIPTGPLNEQTTIYGDVTLYGKGYGHGVGMSQSGARGMAEAGYTYDEILKYYYTGVEIGR